MCSIPKKYESVKEKDNPEFAEWAEENTFAEIQFVCRKTRETYQSQVKNTFPNAQKLWMN